MRLSKIYAALEELAEHAKILVIKGMEENGVNERVGWNTLVGSDLWESVDSRVDDLEMLELVINDYYIYVEKGRKPGTWPPPTAIAAWCQRKGIPSDNSTVFLICRSIYERGIKARPFFENAWDAVDDYWDTWADEVFEIMTADISEWFSY